MTGTRDDQAGELPTPAASRVAGWLVAVVSAAIFFDALDLSITQIALPSIQASMHVPASTLPWIAAGYVVTYGGFLLLGGRAADLLGARRVFLAGLAIFGAGSLACGPEDRTHATSRSATVVGCDRTTVERYFRDTWQARHGGTLSALTELAPRVRAVRGTDTPVELVADELRHFGQVRLVPATPVVYALKSLRSKGLWLRILADPSAEIAAAWLGSPLGALVSRAPAVLTSRCCRRTF
jgi:hypothetical protein